ncbi:MAG TPA: permease prefix domain 1-containing protein [Acidimicrobiia bacterium]|nr:permease prefix domain 1-containing protein [Acidimicrobiia bacterium]
MSQLKERYVAAVLRSIPDDKRADVDAELRGAIEDAVEARVEQGGDPDTVEVTVLTELGDPDRLAADYADRPLWLIGPTFYLPWLRVMKTMLKIIPPIAGVVVAVVGYVVGDGLLGAFFDGLGAAIVAALNVMFWVTLGFIVAERSDEVTKADIEPFTRKWTPNRLPTVPDRQIGYGETIGSLVVLVFVILVIFAQRSLRPAPFFDPDAWNLAIPVILGLLVVSAGFELVKFRVGRWSVGLASFNALLNVAFAGWWLWFFFKGSLLNQAFFDAIGIPDVVDLVARGISIGVVVVSGWSALEGFVKARRASRGLGDRGAIPNA